MRYSIHSSRFPALIVHLKMNEYSGNRLYNHADDRYNSFQFVDSSSISWHHYKETLSPLSNQYSTRLNYMNCNKENYTFVGDHCEYYQCHSDCLLTGKVGLCNGWT